MPEDLVSGAGRAAAILEAWQKGVTGESTKMPLRAFDYSARSPSSPFPTVPKNSCYRYD